MGKFNYRRGMRTRRSRARKKRNKKFDSPLAPFLIIKMFLSKTILVPWRLMLIALTVAGILTVLYLNIGGSSISQRKIREKGAFSLSEEPEALKLNPLSNFAEYMIKEKEQYSSVHCRSRSHTQCLFSNVAIKDKTIIFYEDPTDPLDYIASRFRKEFPDNFITIEAGDLPPVGEDAFMKVIKIQTPIPTSATYMDSHLSVVYKPHSPNERSFFIAEVSV
jgi:hypothetical protein